MNKVRFGIIGCGGISEAHFEGIAKNKETELVAVADILENKAKEMGELYKVPWFTDNKELLKRKDIDAVSICTPSGLHGEIAIEAMKAGKHVLSEKPIDITLKQIDRMIETSDKTGMKVACIFQSRFFEAEQKIKKAVEAGKFGKLVLGDAYNKWLRLDSYYQKAAWRATWELDGGGALMNQAVHAVDLLIHLMGDVASVSAYCTTLMRKIVVEDTATAIVRFKNGALGTIEATTSVYPGFKRKLEIHGSKGSVILTDHEITKWQFEGEEEVKPGSAADSKAGLSTNDPKTSAEGHTLQIQEFAKAIMAGKQPEVNPRDARKAVELILAIYQSSKTGKEVKLPLK